MNEERAKAQIRWHIERFTFEQARVRQDFIASFMVWLDENFPAVVEAAKREGKMPAELVKLAIEQYVRESAQPPRQRYIEVADLRIDTDLCRCERNGKPVHLTVKSYEMLKAFMLNPNRVMSAKDIAQMVWGYPVPTNNFSMQISIVRNSVWGEDWRTSTPTRLETRHARGWVLMVFE